MTDNGSYEAALEAALSRWTAKLGAERVCTDPPVLALAARCTYEHDARIPAVLRPQTVEQVRDVLTIATELGVAVHAVSTGKNWGLGSRLPVRSPSVLIDLSCMNRILDFDETLGTITVQPGVTFTQVDEFLAARNSNLFLAQTGGAPEGSLLANALERGDGNGVYGDRANAVTGLDVILPTGERVYTGYRRFGRSKLATTHRYGVGPSIDGLFLQSNLGVVTEATFWLQPKPDYFQGYSCTIGDDDGLIRLLDAVQALTLSGTIPPGSFTVWNRYKRIAAAKTYPFDAKGGRTPLTPPETGIAKPWMASGSLYADSRAIGLAQRALLDERLSPLCDRIEFFDADHPPAGVLGGFPRFASNSGNLRTAYWRKRARPDGPDYNPEADRCGVLWVCPAAPFAGAVLTEILKLSEDLCLAHGFEAHLGLNPVSGRSVNLFVALMFDLDIPGESARAMACHDALMAAFVRRGHLPYRLGAQSMDALPRAEGDYDAVLARIRAAVDPAGILGPGRYEFGDAPAKTPPVATRRIATKDASYGFRSFTFPALKPLLNFAAGAPSTIAIAAVDGDEPAGLSLGRLSPDGETAVIDSVYAAPAYRWRGVGLALMAAFEAAAGEAGAKGLTISYVSDGPGRPALDRLLARRGFTAPRPETIVLTVAAGPALASPWLQARALPPDYEIHRWADVAARFRDALGEPEDAYGWIPAYLNPLRHEAGSEPETSLALLVNGALRGWCVTHLLPDGLVRYSSNYAHPDEQQRGWMTEVWRRSILAGQAQGRDRGVWTVSRREARMFAFARRRMAPIAERVAEYLRADKPLR